MTDYTFLEQSPEHQAFVLSSNLGKLSASDQKFARSLLGASRRSDKQNDWVKILAERATKPPPAPTAIGGKVTELVNLLDKAGQKLKHPALIVRVDGQDIRLSVAGPRAQLPGSINVTTPGTFASRRWFGRIHRDGGFEASKALDQNTETAIFAALQRLAADPAGVAAEYGRTTGNCCFCELPLKDPNSLAVGYGRVCAKHFGLPYGKRALAAQAA